MAMGRYEQALALINQYKAGQADKNLKVDIALDNAYCLYMLGKTAWRWRKSFMSKRS